MKEYNKEKLHEYAKELFALCLEKGLNFDYSYGSNSIYTKINNMLHACYLCPDLFQLEGNDGIIRDMPIWELIEKVKQL